MVLILDPDTDIKEVWICGDSDSGALGLGRKDIQKSQFVRLGFIGGEDIPQIQCGTYNSWILMKEKNRNKFWTTKQIKEDPLSAIEFETYSKKARDRIVKMRRKKLAEGADTKCCVVF